MAAAILSWSGANCASTMRMPSGPARMPMVPPDPSSAWKLPAILVALISTLLKSCCAPVVALVRRAMAKAARMVLMAAPVVNGERAIEARERQRACPDSYLRSAIGDGGPAGVAKLRDDGGVALKCGRRGIEQL